MTLVTELDLPELDLSDPSLVGDGFHDKLKSVRNDGWLARSPLAFLVLDRAGGEVFLRSRSTAFPGRQLAALFGITSGPLFDHIDANILNLESERHRRLRGIVSREFSPAAADRWRPTMQEILDRCWSELGASGHAEFVEAIAKPYPALTIAAVLGAPAEDAPRLHRWSSWVQRQFDVKALSTDLVQIEAAVIEVNEYVEALLASSTASTDSSLLTSLLNAEADGERLSHRECMNLVVNVLAGAIDTTQSQLSHAIHLFATHPEQWSDLVSSTELAPAAVTEVLRMEPVAPFTARICVEDVECHGVVFPAGTIVAICAERANREVEMGESFDIAARRESRPLTFGAGPHYCLGANLARAELEEALAFLAPRMPALELDGTPTFGGIEGIYGIETLPVRWAP